MIMKSLFVIDTPGQIEVFSWSASGSIITQSLSTTFPTVNKYIILSLIVRIRFWFM